MHWVTSERFDVKPDKSSWTEVGDALVEHGAKVNIITSYREQPYRSAVSRAQMVYLQALDLPLVYRVAFAFAAFRWLRRNAAPNDIVIVNQQDLWLLPLLRRIGMRNFHLDIRTLPVLSDSLKGKLDRLLFWRLAMKRVGRSCTSHSFITTRLREAVEAEFGSGHEHFVIWESGVNSKFFADAAATATDHDLDRPFTFFYHGSLSVKRGLATVVDAFASLPAPMLAASRFVIVGGGDGLHELQNQVARLGLEQRVELRGLVPYERIPEQIMQADVCICPLPDLPEWNVSSPLKVLEYMACARPMILTPIVAHRDVVGTQPFVMWAKPEVQAFSDAMTTAIERREELSRAASIGPRIVADHWDWKAQGDKLAMYLADCYRR